MIRYLFFFFFLLILPVFSQSQWQIFSYTKPDVMARGGAVTGLSSSYAFYSWNPAAYSISKKEIEYDTYKNITFDFSRFLYYLLDDLGKYSEPEKKPYDDEYEYTQEDKNSWFYYLVFTFLRSIKESKFTAENFYVGFNIYENLSVPTKNDDYLGFNNHYHSMTLGVKITDFLAIGTELEYLHLDDKYNNNSSGFANLTGIYLNPIENLGLGLTYCNFENKIYSSREFLDRMVDDAINFGFSYSLNNLVFSYDLKNINQYKKNAYLESHYGISYLINFFYDYNLNLLTGYYKNNNDFTQNYSYGFSIYNSDRDKKGLYLHLDLSMLYEKGLDDINHYWFLSFGAANIKF